MEICLAMRRNIVWAHGHGARMSVCQDRYKLAGGDPTTFMTHVLPRIVTVNITEKHEEDNCLSKINSEGVDTS